MMDQDNTRAEQFADDIEVITFDAANTLIFLPRPVGEHYAEVGRRHGLRGSAEAWQNSFGKAWKDLPRPARTDGPSPDDHRGWWRELVRVAMADALDQAAIPESEAFERFFDDLYTHFEQPGVWHLTEPGLPELLADLREAGFRLGVLSNFDLRLRRILGDLGIARFFESLVISSQVGVEKPDRQIFEAAREALGRPEPQNCLHVGDEERSDLLGAHDAGWHAWRVLPGEKSLEDLRALL